MDARIFTTEKVAKILGLPEWRIVRFAQMKSFGIIPAYADAQGPGSRRLYDLENVCEFALAAWCLQSGLRTEVIGRVLTNVREKKGLSHLFSKSPSQLKSYCLGIKRTPKGKVLRQAAVEIGTWEDVQDIFHEDKSISLLIIPVGQRFMDLRERIEDR